MNLSPTQRIAAAVLSIGDSQRGCAPYYGVALAMLIRVPVDGLLKRAGGEMAVTEDGLLLYDPKGISKWSIKQLAAVLEHEVQHVLLQHLSRARALHVAPGTDDARLANCAMDACINDSLRQSGRSLPDDCIYSSTLGQSENLIFEERYRLLKADPSKARELLDSGGGPGAGSCGGCAGNPSPVEAEYGKQGRSEAELHRARRQVAEAVRDYARKDRGGVPSELQRWAEEFLGPAKIDWRQEFARAFRSARAWKSGATDFGFSRPSRRQGGIGYGPGCTILPSLRSPIVRAAAIVDTSGSMGTAELSAALAEVRGVMMATAIEIDLCACDAAVHGITSIRRWEDAAHALKGGGGTDMRPAFDALLARKPKPDIVICMTDGLVGDGVPEFEPPGVRVIWVLLGPYQQEPCAWGKHIHVVE